MKSCVVCAAALLCSVSLSFPAQAGGLNPSSETAATVQQQLLVVPEPAVLLLLGVALSLLAITVRTRRRT
jgi:hypothetical protein